MSKFFIVENEGVGELSFNYDRSKIRKLGGNFTEFKKSKFSNNTSDDFGNFHAFYDIDNKLEAVECFPEMELYLNQKKLFDMNYDELKKYLNDSNIEEDDSGCIFYTRGISVYAPNKKDIESILVFRSGYYD